MGVQEAVLGLLVENGPLYGYQLVKECDATRAAVYKVLDRLLDQGLIEPVEAVVQDTRPRKWYQATALGQARYDSLIARATRERHRKLRQRLLAATLDDLPEVLDDVETHLLDELQADPGQETDPVARIIALERRLVSEARLRWVEEARELIAHGSPVA